MTVACRGASAARRTSPPRRAALLAIVVVAALLAACSTAPRLPVGEEQIAGAAPRGITQPVRFWGDSIGEESRDTILAVEVVRARQVHRERLASEEPLRETILALSGGGADGAFGAGLLAGWTARGDRPEFDVVSGVSTGAIIGLLAFLGPDYDTALERFYTTYATDDLFTASPFAALSGGPALLDASGFNAIVDAFIDDAVVARLAEEQAAGRILLIGTTNLDAARPVIWSVTDIAASGHPEAKALIRDVVRASAAIPAAMPPIVIPAVLPDGTRRDELHVDGGATQQVMLFSPELPIKEVDAVLGTEIERTIYIIVNNALSKPYAPVDLGVLSIAGKAVSSLIGGSGSGDLYKIYAIAERDEVDFNVTWVPKSFDREPEELFDPAYMRALYDLGFERGLAGDAWRSHPPFF
ncbi:MAG: patatin-like phospholipase family protein, partial [Pseudomonadota bacterium]